MGRPGWAAADVEHLARVWVFDGCDRRELMEVDARAADLRVRAGRTLCRQGARAREVVVLIDGFATVTRGGQLQAQIGPGTVLGARELVAGGGHATTVTTKTVARVLVFGAQDFLDLVEEAPDMAARLTGWVPARRVDRRAAAPARLPAPVGLAPA